MHIQGLYVSTKEISHSEVIIQSVGIYLSFY